IAGDDGFRGLDHHLGVLCLGHFLIPAVVLGYRTIRREAVVRVGRSAATTRRQGRVHRKCPDCCMCIQYRWIEEAASAVRRFGAPTPVRGSWIDIYIYRKPKTHLSTGSTTCNVVIIRLVVFLLFNILKGIKRVLL